MKAALRLIASSTLLAAANTSPSLGTCWLLDNYSPPNFFDRFDFFTDVDPTHGFVQYVNKTYARSKGLIETCSDSVRFGVDHKNVYTTNGTFGIDTGRTSIRLQSKSTYTHGLFVLSLNHMPWGCGAWPAWWTLGPSWPTNGEVDIIENVNLQSENLMSLHTSRGCTISGQDELGTVTKNDCFSDGGANSGCSVQSNSSSSFGSKFNSQGGGTYAMEWTSSYIRIWNWAAGSEPQDLMFGTPNPDSWGQPVTNFQGSCDIDNHFQQHQIVFDVTFCGDFAGETYGTSSCPQIYGLSGRDSCNAYVARNPAAFQDTYWDINCLKVYQHFPATSNSTLSSTPLSSVTPFINSSSVNIGQGASTTETKSPSATVDVPPQPDTL